MHELMYMRWMDMPIIKDQWLALPCGHTVSRESLRIAGGLCPVCEQDKDAAEMSDEEFVAGFNLNGGYLPRRDI